MAYLDLKEAPFHVTSGGALIGGGYRPKKKAKRHCVREGMGPSGRRKCLEYAPGPYGPYGYQHLEEEYAGGILLGGRHPSMGKRHCVKERKGASGKKRCKKFAPGPGMGGAYSGGAYSGGCRCCQRDLPVGLPLLEGRGGSMAQKAAAKKNPWLKFLKKYRAEAKRAGVAVDLRQASRAYHAQRG